ncbi:MAG: hypothetical protein ACWA40_07300 [Planktomarina sp.]
MTVSPRLLTDIPQNICETINQVLPDLNTCKAIEGKFDLTELKRQSFAAPAVLVSILGAGQDVTYAGSSYTFKLSFAAYVVTRDSMSLPRAQASAAIVQALMGLVPGQNWGEPALGAAQNVKASCLVSTKVQSSAVSLWAVTWDQPMTLFCEAPQIVPIELYVADAPNQSTPRGQDDFSKLGEA